MGGDELSLNKVQPYCTGVISTALVRRASQDMVVPCSRRGTRLARRTSNASAGTCSEGPKVKEWLEKHPRFLVHFTPTSASWLNMVERFFRDITTDRLRRGVFRSVPELTKAIKEFIAIRNKNPKPFVWTRRPTTS